MKKLIILLALTLNCGISSAQDIFSCVPVDKRLHALTSYVVCDIAKDYGASKQDKFWIITGLGIAKELYDANSGSKFDLTDILADYVGFVCEGSRVDMQGGKLVISNEWLL